MSEHVKSAVVGEAVGTVASFVRNKLDELSTDRAIVEELEWVVLKIESAIEESKKYDICKKYDIINKPLREMQQKFIDMVAKAQKILHKDVTEENSTVTPVRKSFHETLVYRMFNKPPSVFFYDLIMCLFPQLRRKCSDNANNLLVRMQTAEKLNNTLEKLAVMSNDVGVFLEMVRRQKLKRGRRRRYRPYKGFFELVYLELVQDALRYCRAHVSWMRFLLPEMAALINSNRASGLKTGGASSASMSAVPKVLLDVLKFSHKSLLLV